MSRKILLSLPLIVLFLSFGSLVSAQDMDQKAYMDDIGVTMEQMQQFQDDFVAGITELQQNAQQRIINRISEEAEAGNTPTPEMGLRLAMEEMMLPMADIYQTEMNKHFSAGQIEKMQLRNFQMYHGIMDGIEETDDPLVIAAGSQFGTMQLVQGYPDFLELTPAQKEELHDMAMENAIEVQRLTLESTMKFMQENPERFQELAEAGKKITDAKSIEEQQEIAKGLQGIVAEMYGDKIPELKELVAKNNKKFMSVMTDAQKAKIQKVMDDVPDYIWATFPQNRDKDRPWRPGLDSWMPGMGVPGVGSANRETRQKRSQEKRTFPGQEEE